MTDNGSSHDIWSILNTAFETILHTLQFHLSSIKMLVGHSSNENFLFRAYAEYSFEERIIVLSFDVQKKDYEVLIFGDISKESGFILKDIIYVTIPLNDLNDEILKYSHIFASRCEEEINLLITELGEAK